MSIQSDIKSNSTKIAINEEQKPQYPYPYNNNSFIEVKSYQNNENNNNITNNEQGTIYSVNSDQIRPILSKYLYSKLGNCHSFFADDLGNPLFIIGPHWPLFLTVILLISIFFIVVEILFKKILSTYMNLLGFFVYILFLISFIYTGIINPGYPKHDEDSLNNKNQRNNKFCEVCKIWVNTNIKTKHCNFCNICVEKMDHHCPWTGKCIGKRNLFPFYIFILAVYGFIGYEIYIILSFKDKLTKKK